MYLTDRFDTHKKLRAGQTRDPYDWTRVEDIVGDDRLEYCGVWCRVVDTCRAGDSLRVSIALEDQIVAVDYLPFEAVKVRVPRPSMWRPVA